MRSIDFDRVDEELGLVTPRIYRMFMEAVRKKRLDLGKHGISHDAASIIEGNLTLRERLAGQSPAWKDHYLDIGVGDGCGNHFFLVATDEDDDSARLWAHDPAGIEKVGTATDFLMDLLAEVEAGFDGPHKYRFQGNG